jgi:hypothetical protein
VEKANSHWISGIAIEGDVVRGQQYVPFARRLLRNLSERMKLGDIALGRDFARLADDAYCYAIIHNSIHRCVIVVDAPEAGMEPDQAHEAPEDYPDFYSGFVLSGRSVETTEPGRLEKKEVLSSFLPTALCSRLHDIPESPQQSRKLHVMPWDAFSEELSSGSDAITLTQYSRLKPTLYSGRMRKCIQALLGFGRQHKPSIYVVELDGDAGSDEPVPMTKYQRDVAKNGVQIRYDWRWFRTHGILRGPDGTDWLIEIGSTRGVIAMPLPLHEKTASDEFRNLVNSMSDSAARAVLDEFGAFPTGEGFPSGDIEPWIRAGRVVRLASADDLREFYSRTEYSTSMGWAFNVAGTEAVNTCWSFDDRAYQKGYLFSLITSISALDKRAPAPNAGRLRERLSEYRPQEGERERYEAAVWKCNRLHEETIRDILAFNRSPETIFQAVDMADAIPYGTGSSSLRLQSMGTLYWPFRLQRFIKFPEPLLGYLVSHNMDSTTGGAPPSGDEADSDTICHAFFIENRLHYCRFINTFREIPEATVESTFTDCMYVGKYTQTTYSAGRGVPPMMVTESFDDRQETAPSINTMTREGVDLGYMRCQYGDDPVFPYRGAIQRQKVFRITSTTSLRSGVVVTSGVTVPFYDRCSYLYAFAEGAATNSETISKTSVYLTDPHWCQTWRNFPGYTGFLPMGCIDSIFFPGCWRLGEHPAGCGKVIPRTVWTVEFDEFECSEFANSGPWCAICDNAETMIYNIPPPPSESTHVSKPGEYHRTVHLVCDSQLSPIPVEVRYLRTGLNYENPWFLPSPDEFGNTQYADSTCNAFGSASTLRVHLPAGAEQPAVRVEGAPRHPDMEGAITCIGVIP